MGYAAALRVAANEKKLLAIEAELETARRIQSSILPARAPQVPGLDVAMRYVPAASVAGDFYDFLAADGRCVGILVADVSGHGVPAALIASMVKVAFSSQADHADNPAAVLREMNRIFFGHSPESFVTAGYLYLDLPSRTMRYASAGHPPLLLWRKSDGQVRAFRESGVVMGPFPDGAYANMEFALETGDRLLLYTDGITEAENEAEELFGEERLLAFVAANGALPVGRFADGLLAEVASWSGAPDGIQRDDVTLIVVDLAG